MNKHKVFDNFGVPAILPLPYYSQMKLHVRMLLFENSSELLSLGIVRNGVHEEDVTVDVHVTGEIVPDMSGDGLLSDPCPGACHHGRVDQVIA